jgi:hypothetical protein
MRHVIAITMNTSRPHNGRVVRTPLLVSGLWIIASCSILVPALSAAQPDPGFHGSAFLEWYQSNDLVYTWIDQPPGGARVTHTEVFFDSFFGGPADGISTTDYEPAWIQAYSFSRDKYIYDNTSVPTRFWHWRTYTDGQGDVLVGQYSPSTWSPAAIRERCSGPYNGWHLYFDDGGATKYYRADSDHLLQSGAGEMPYVFWFSTTVRDETANRQLAPAEIILPFAPVNPNAYFIS